MARLASGAETVGEHVVRCGPDNGRGEARHHRRTELPHAVYSRCGAWNVDVVGLLDEAGTSRHPSQRGRLSESQRDTSSSPPTYIDAPRPALTGF